MNVVLGIISYLHRVPLALEAVGVVADRGVIMLRVKISSSKSSLIFLNPCVI